MSQEYVMEYYWFPNQTNPSYIVMRVFGEDKIKQFNLQPNDEVRVRFHIEAHEYNGRWFNETRLDAVTFIGASASKNHQPAPSPQPQDGGTGAAPAAAQSGTGAAPQAQASNGSDDLPF